MRSLFLFFAVISAAYPALADQNVEELLGINDIVLSYSPYDHRVRAIHFLHSKAPIILNDSCSLQWITIQGRGVYCSPKGDETRAFEFAAFEYEEWDPFTGWSVLTLRFSQKRARLLAVLDTESKVVSRYLLEVAFPRNAHQPRPE